jgi:hypothetical protein
MELFSIAGLGRCIDGHRRGVHPSVKIEDQRQPVGVQFERKGAEMARKIKGRSLEGNYSCVSL